MVGLREGKKNFHIYLCVASAGLQIRAAKGVGPRAEAGDGRGRAGEGEGVRARACWLK